MNVKKVFTTCLLKIVAVRHWTNQRKSNQQQQQAPQLEQPMDTLASSKLQMTENLSPMKLNDGDEPEIYEIDENQENNGLKRQRISDCVQMAKNRNKSQQPCACDHQHETHMKTVRCIVSTTAESPPNATNGMIHLKDAHNTNHPNDPHKSNGLYHIENSRENVISTTASDGSNKIFANLCASQNDGYFDSMVSSDMSDVDMKLAEEKEKCTADIFSNGIDQNGCDRVIIRGHRRARARSSDSVQAEFYQARKQQLRLQSQHDSDVSKISKNVEKFPFDSISPPSFKCVVTSKYSFVVQTSSQTHVRRTQSSNNMKV